MLPIVLVSATLAPIFFLVSSADAWHNFAFLGALAAGSGVFGAVLFPYLGARHDGTSTHHVEGVWAIRIAGLALLAYTFAMTFLVPLGLAFRTWWSPKRS